MSKQGQRDIREYHLTSPIFNLATAAMGEMVFPASGYISKITALVTTDAAVGDSILTFELNGTTLKSGGSAASITIDTADNVGRVRTVVTSVDNGDNFVYEGDEADVQAQVKPSVLEIISDAGGTGNVQLTFTIRP